MSYHRKKYNLDTHLKTYKHERQKKKIAESSETLDQQNLIIPQTQVTDKQEINVDLIKAFTKTEIPLEKVEKLKPYCQLRQQYLPLVYNVELEKLRIFYLRQKS